MKNYIPLEAKIFPISNEYIFLKEKFESNKEIRKRIITTKNQNPKKKKVENLYYKNLFL